MSDRDRMLARAEALIAAAVAILYPACGEQLTIGIVQQMAEEQARLTTYGRLTSETPPSEVRH